MKSDNRKGKAISSTFSMMSMARCTRLASLIVTVKRDYTFVGLSNPESVATKTFSLPGWSR